MIYTGLVSVTFRKLKVQEIIQLTAKAGLQGIEWGGDIHVPHGDLETARQVGKATIDAGLQVASYGSYYRVGEYENAEQEFKKVLETASALGAPTVRVWAGRMSSAETDEPVWRKIADESRLIADMAQEKGIRVAYEYHANTLTDTTESAIRLMREVNHPNMFSYWQPPVHMSFEERMLGLQAIIPWLSNVHVFHWVVKDKVERQELSGGLTDWNHYMEEILAIPGDRYAMLEFVRDDAPEQFLKDAETLKHLVNPA